MSVGRSPTLESVQFNYFVPSHVQHLATMSPRRAAELLREHSIVDFVGRQENLTMHLAEAFIGAGAHRTRARAP